MASQNPSNPSPVGRKVRRLGIGIVVVMALYTAAWFYGANRLDRFLANTLAGQTQGEVQAECGNLSVGGYPFLIGVTCDRIRFVDGGSGLDAAFGAFRSAARIYMPGTAVLELDGPARLDLTRSGIAVDGNWQSMRASVGAGLDGLKRASVEGRDVAFHVASDVTYQIFDLKIGHAEWHVRANGGDLDLALLAEKLDFRTEGQPPLLPELSASAELTLVGKAHVLGGSPYGSLETKGELRSFKADLGNGIYGELSGPISIDAEGWVSGELTMMLENLDLWEKTLVSAFPDAGATISGMADMLRGLQKDKARVTVNLSIDRGTISLSMIPIGHIPQI
jgi:hypothetical protein